MFTLPDLPYQSDALEPVISRKIMELHHGKHHAGYVKNLDAATTGSEYTDMPIEKMLRSLDTLPEKIRTAVRNNGGGHANHSLFWTIMRPPSENNAPTQNVAKMLTASFGSVETFKQQLQQTAMIQFGSGWGWLVKNAEGKLTIYSTPNQDSPYMSGDTPILGVDVWEHAYYLDYLNDRGAYLSKWWNIVNWDEVGKRLEM